MHLIPQHTCLAHLLGWSQATAVMSLTSEESDKINAATVCHTILLSGNLTSFWGYFSVMIFLRLINYILQQQQNHHSYPVVEGPHVQTDITHQRKLQFLQSTKRQKDENTTVKAAFQQVLSKYITCNPIISTHTVL